MASTSEEYWQDIQKIFGLPENTKKAIITLEVNKEAVAECVVFIDAQKNTTTTKRYKLVEIHAHGD